ncbi:Uncharacterised protein [Mycobacteroides abscessus subsp. abscessus]|nr:Uncharacterised protein [Mycobacteroides abscessus subsp. abscessus]SLB67899.1 Uncharacterised protein [Mycobacteroides abscessus subsp. abscessus]
MVDEKGKTAQSVSGGYSSSAGKLREQAGNYNTISAWMSDASGKVLGAKKRIASLVMAGTQEIRDALDSELAGTPVTPSSTALADKYRNDIAAVATKLTIDLDAIGHSLAGDPGASTAPTYVRAAESSTTPTVEQAAMHHALTGEGPSPEPHQLPEMPRVTSAPTTESLSIPSTPAAPMSPNPTLAGLIAGSASPSSTPASPSAKSSSAASSGIPAGQAHQPTEQHQQIRPTDFPRIPSIPLPDAPAVAADIATAVTSSVGHQLPATSTTPATPLAPASTGFTPGTSGTPPILPTAPAPLTPIGGLTTPPVVQAPPAPQGTPLPPGPGVQAAAPQSPAPAAPRGPVADLGWIQKTYGIAPGLDLPKSESPVIPALFIAGLPEGEAHLHRALATLRQQFESAGWSQPLVVASIRRGFEVKTVFCTADAISIHPQGVSLPSGVFPLDEMPSTPTHPDLSGSLMVTDKLRALIPRGWELEGLLSTVPADENSQSTEQYQELSDAGELLPCKGSRGRDDVTAGEAMGTFARAALGSQGCGELDTDSARLKAARWIGTQPAGYLDTLSRYYLSDAAESMSQGRWGEAVWACEKYMNVNQTRSQAA